jgi:hypothetical protein
MEIKSLKIIYYKDDDVLFEIEPNSEGVFLHCEVTNWKPSVLKKSYRVFGEFLNFAQHHKIKKVVTTTPNPKFALLFGGKVINSGEIDGVYHEVIEWEVVH